MVKLKLFGSWWDLVYLTYAHKAWDTNIPPKELVDLVEAQLIEPCRVLDVGCGTGNYTIYLALNDFEAVGIDISSVSIKKAKAKSARKNINCQFYAVDFLESNTLNNLLKDPFDLVIDYGCLHSLFSTQNKRQYIHSLKSLVRHGSLYLLWAFQRNTTFLFGLSAGIDAEEVRELFWTDFKILEQRAVTRKKILYTMECK